MEWRRGDPKFSELSLECYLPDEAVLPRRLRVFNCECYHFEEAAVYHGSRVSQLGYFLSRGRFRVTPCAFRRTNLPALSWRFRSIFRALCSPNVINPMWGLRIIARVYRGSHFLSPRRRFRITARAYCRSNILTPKWLVRIMARVHQSSNILASRGRFRVIACV